MYYCVEIKRKLQREKNKFNVGTLLKIEQLLEKSYRTVEDLIVLLTHLTNQNGLSVNLNPLHQLIKASVQHVQ